MWGSLPIVEQVICLGETNSRELCLDVDAGDATIFSNNGFVRFLSVVAFYAWIMEEKPVHDHVSMDVCSNEHGDFCLWSHVEVKVS